ncbi:melanopsin-like [Oculina patagonica]
MDEKGEFPSPLHDALAGLIAILLVLAPIEQILTLKILLRVDNRRKRLTPYIINLVAANVLFVFFNFPLSVASNLSRRYVSGKPVCIFLGYISSASVLVTFATFAACTGIVYYATNELTTAPRAVKRRKDIIIILGIWLLAFAILSPMIAFWRQETFQPGTTGCTPVRTLQTPGDIAYFVILTVVAFSTPIGISFVYSIKTYLYFAQIKPFQMSFLQQQKYREYKNVSKMIIVSVVVFVICWTPFAIVGLLSVFGYTPSPELRAIPYLLPKTSVLYNPIIYAIFNAK